MSNVLAPTLFRRWMFLFFFCLKTFCTFLTWIFIVNWLHVSTEKQLNILLYEASVKRTKMSVFVIYAANIKDCEHLNHNLVKGIYLKSCLVIVFCDTVRYLVS